MQTENNNKKREKPTPEQILVNLEKTGITFTPVGLGPWSHSKLKVLRNCPLKFYLQYVLKVKPEEEQPISLITEVGKAAHRILELSIGGKEISQAFKITRQEFAKTISDAEWMEHVASVEFNIGKFMERMDSFEKEHGIKRIFQEIRIGCTSEWEPTGFFSEDVYFRSVIDLAIQLNNSDLIILDHKYGTVKAMGLRNFMDQLNTYKVMFHKGIEPISGAMSGIHHIKEGEVALGDYSDAEEIENSLLTRIEFSLQGAIDQLMEIGYWKHVAGNWCKYCDYRDACKSGKFKQLELDSKKWFQIRPVS